VRGGKEVEAFFFIFYYFFSALKKADILAVEFRGMDEERKSPYFSALIWINVPQRSMCKGLVPSVVVL
jgi:hypothetical protein